MQRSVGVAVPPRKVWNCSHGVRGFMGLGLALVLGGSSVGAQSYFDVLGSVDPGSGGLLVTLTPARDGTFYGTTASGGAFGMGTVFRMTAGVRGMTVLHDFAGGADGQRPEGALIQASDGNFYGTTLYGGGTGTGTVFRMTPDGIVTVLYAFAGGNGGRLPAAALVEGMDGDFYGTTQRGGPFDSGIIFKMTRSGSVTILHAFHYPEPAYPGAALIQARDGNFYGTTIYGGPTDAGGTFRMTPDGTVTVQHSFVLEADGGYLAAPLLQATDGNFYGVAAIGGVHGSGTVFEITQDGTFSVLHAFTGGADGGASFRGALTQTSSGNIYGTTGSGGTFGGGTVFQLSAGGAVTVLHSLTHADGINPGPLVEATDGSLYGTTESSGLGSSGIVFRVGATPLVNRSFTADFDGDGRSDLVVYRPTTGVWYVRTSSTGYSYANATSYQWGIAGDIPIAADFDGDHETDLAVYRPPTGEWFVRSSSSGYSYATAAVYQWGIAGDVPLVGDFDGDGKSDLTVWRPSTGEWYVRFSSTRYASWAVYQWGVAGDIPLVADFDGDGKTDLVVWRPDSAVWYVRLSSSGYTSWTSYQWGVAGDVPLVADFDGDGKTDLAVWRPITATWYVRFSSSHYAEWAAFQWGVNGDLPIQADFDGDGRTDLTVWRPRDGTWYLRFSSAGNTPAALVRYQWGAFGDDPM